MRSISYKTGESITLSLTYPVELYLTKITVIIFFVLQKSYSVVPVIYHLFCQLAGVLLLVQMYYQLCCQVPRRLFCHIVKNFPLFGKKNSAVCFWVKIRVRNAFFDNIFQLIPYTLKKIVSIILKFVKN